MRPVPALIALLLAGCTLEEHEFPDAYGRLVCKRLHECQRSDYDTRYDDRRSCVDEWAEFADSILDLGDTFGNEYSPEGAQECLANIRAATCQEFSDFEYTCQVMQ